MMARKTKEVVGEVKKTTVRDVVYAILPVVSIALLVGLWIWVSQKYPLLFPSPAQTWERLVKLFKVPVMRVSYPGHILASLGRVFIALLFSWAIGISFGILIGWNRKMDAFFGTIFAFIRPIPPIAWIPLITILMGTSEASKILIVFIGAVMPVVINTHDGVRNVEDVYKRQGQVWECAMFAPAKKLTNVITFVDANKLQLDGTTDEVCALGDLQKKFTDFGWQAIDVADGNDVEQILAAIRCV